MMIIYRLQRVHIYNIFIHICNIGYFYPQIPHVK